MSCMHPITTNTLLNTNTKDETRYAVHLHRTAQANDTKRQLALSPDRAQANAAAGLKICLELVLRVKF